MNRLRVWLWANLYMEYFEQKALSTAPHSPGFGTGLWMTYLSSTRKSTKRTSYNTSTVLTLPFSLQWRTIRRMGRSPSWTPLSNQRLIVAYLSLCTGNPPTQTSAYSWEVTITSSAKFSVIHNLSHRAQTVCSNPELLHKDNTHLRNALIQCKYPKWALDKVERRLNKPSSEASDGANNQGPVCYR